MRTTMIPMTTRSSTRVKAALEGVRERRFISAGLELLELTGGLHLDNRNFSGASHRCSGKPLRDAGCPLLSAPPNSGTGFNQHFFFVMSQHRSLKGSSTIAAKRNVLKR